MQGGSLFSSKINPEIDVDSKDLKTQTVQLMMSDSLADRFNILDVDEELSASILSGLVKVSGSGKFIEENRPITSKASSMSFIHKLEMAQDEIDIQDLKKKIEYDALDTMEATHVVTGITWGAIYTIRAQYTFDNIETKGVIEKAVK